MCFASVSCDVVAALTVAMDKTFIERRVYKGAKVRRGYRVKSISCVKDDPGSRPSEIITVKSLSEYESGCPLHRGGCFGHMCEIESGDLLMPHSMPFRAGDIRTQYNLAASAAFAGNTEEYREILTSTCSKKYGTLRGVMSVPVSGGARLVAVPHNDENVGVVFLSENLLNKIKFCAPESIVEYGDGSRYEERSPKEGEYIILERPPSLTKRNNQPFRIKYWNKECMGVHPGVFKYFHGDYDGDEVHTYPLGTVEAIEECKQWKHTVDPSFIKASSTMRKRFPERYEGTCSDGDLKFMEYTTLSFAQMREGKYRLLIGNETRNKRDHIDMMTARLRRTEGTSDFVQNAIKGVSDIMRQQLPQGTIGDMSRTARYAAMCVTRDSHGEIHILGRRGPLGTGIMAGPSTGSPAVRCIMLLCSKAQQAALDAHRVGSKASTSMDLISDLLLGRSVHKASSPCNTLYVFSNVTRKTCFKRMSPAWMYRTDGHLMCIAKDDAMPDDMCDKLVAAYSPVVLSKCSQSTVREICRRALCIVMNYYSLEVEYNDIEDLAVLFSHKVSSSTCPITTRAGMERRGMGWLETLLVLDYKAFGKLIGGRSPCVSSASSTFCANFGYLP